MPNLKSSAQHLITKEKDQMLANLGLRPKSAWNSSEGIRAFMNRLENGEQSIMLPVVGDSTGDDTEEFPFQLGVELSKVFKNTAFVYESFQDGTQQYGLPTLISPGAAGQRYISYVGGGQKARYLPTTVVGFPANDLEGRYDVALDNWTPGVTTSFGGLWASGTNKAWRFRINAASGGVCTLVLEYTADGSTIKSATSSVGLPTNFLAGGRYRLGFQLDVDNSASGGTTKFFTQADNGAWTQLGADVVVAGAIAALNQPAGNYELGGTQSQTSVITGRIYGVELRDGIGGPVMNPMPLEAWSTEDIATPLGGSPTVYIKNGSVGGKDFAYFSNATRFAKVCPRGNHPVILVNLGHNQNQHYTDLITEVNALQAQIDARLPCAQAVALNQNPRVAPGASAEPYVNRTDTIIRRFVKKRGSFINTQLPFITSGKPLSETIDGTWIHPTAIGKVLVNQAVVDAFLAHRPLQTPNPNYLPFDLMRNG